MNKTFYSNGKLLLTSEYLVLDGAQALGIPTKQGQSLSVKETHKEALIWQSIDVNNAVWLDFNFKTSALDQIPNAMNDPKSRLIQILAVAKELNPNFLNDDKGYTVTTKLDFPQNWGLGSSSTLIANIAQWANVNPYSLLEKTFGGSGYDIACANHPTPLLYRKTKNEPVITSTPLKWNFTEHLYFIHLNKKQDSRLAISHYRKQPQTAIKEAVNKANLLTQHIINCTSLDDFKKLLEEHEQHIGSIINIKPIKERLFSNFSGSIKSLGGWGGDFILATGHDAPQYFKNLGFNTVIPYKQMVL